MKRAKRFRQQSLYRVGVVIYFICVQWIFVNSAFGSYTLKTALSLNGHLMSILARVGNNIV